MECSIDNGLRRKNIFPNLHNFHIWERKLPNLWQKKMPMYGNTSAKTLQIIKLLQN